MSGLFQLFAATADSCAKHGFLGLKPWYHYLPNNRFDDSCNIVNFRAFPPHSDVPRILLAVVDDLLRIAALVAIAFVIVGAIRMIASQGEPEGAAKARDTVINALIGLAIAIVGAAFVAFLGSRLGG